MENLDEFVSNQPDIRWVPLSITAEYPQGKYYTHEM